MTEDNRSGEIPLRELVRRLAARRWLLLGVFAFVLAAVIAFTFLVTPRYKSSARLRIDTKTQSGMPSLLGDQTGNVPGASLLGLGRDELETEIGVLRSDRVRDAAIDSLGLGIQVKTPPGNRARVLSMVHVVDPAFDVDGKLTLSQQGAGRYRIEKSGLEEVRTLPATAKPGDTLRVGGTVLVLSPDLARGGPPKIVIRVLPRYKVYKLLDQRLSVERQEGGSRLVEVSYEDPDRQLAAQVVRRVVAEYVAYSDSTEEAQDTTGVTRMRREVDSTARKLAQAEAALRAFEEQSRLISPEEQASAQVKRISAISTHVDQISVERNALAQMLEIINQRSKNGTDPAAYRQLATFPSLITNRAIQDLLQSLVDLENKRAQLGATRTPQNIEYKQLTDRITEIENQLYHVGPQYLESLDHELQTTANTVTALTDTLQAMPAAATRYGQLLRDRTVQEALYLGLQKQLKQTEVTNVLRMERVHVVDPPRVANLDDPAFPRKTVMILLGLILGLVVAVTAGLIMELWSAPAYSA